MPRVRAVGLTLALAAGALVLGADPAGAHGVGGIQPTNYQTRVAGVTPRAPGVQVRAIDLGARLELRNDTAVEVTVLGYDGEPYLRVGPRGVYRNARSPAVFLNKSTTVIGKVPPGYDSAAPPRWERVSGGRTVRWHDHRTHWMGGSDPPSVAAAPDHFHVVIDRWTVPLRVGERAASVTGSAVWVPGPTPWPWILGAVALAGGLALLGRTRRWPTVLTVALVGLVACDVVHAFGVWQASTSPLLGRTVASVYSIGGWVIAAVALTLLRRRDDPYDATPVALLAGLVLAIAGGLADVTTLTRSQLPTVLANVTARLVVTGTIGIGVGVVIVAAMHLRRQIAPSDTPARVGPPQRTSRV